MRAAEYILSFAALPEAQSSRPSHSKRSSQSERRALKYRHLEPRFLAPLRNAGVFWLVHFVADSHQCPLGTYCGADERIRCMLICKDGLPWTSWFSILEANIAKIYATDRQGGRRCCHALLLCSTSINVGGSRTKLLHVHVLPSQLAIRLRH